MENVETAALHGQETKLQALEAAGAATEGPVRPKRKKKTKKPQNTSFYRRSTKHKSNI